MAVFLPSFSNKTRLFLPRGMGKVWATIRQVNVPAGNWLLVLVAPQDCRPFVRNFAPQ